jgi:hypothetical protein
MTKYWESVSSLLVPAFAQATGNSPWEGTVASIVAYIAILSVNVFSAAFVLIRKFFLKDTGRKLSHLDKQLHVGQTEMPVPGFEQESD